jgi:hypothetical protein
MGDNFSKSCFRRSRALSGRRASRGNGGICRLYRRAVRGEVTHAPLTPARPIAAVIRNISTSPRSGILSYAQALAAHEFTGRRDIINSRVLSPPGRRGPEETIFTPDETVFACPRKRPETVASAAWRHGQTMRFDHVGVYQLALPRVLQSPPGGDATIPHGRSTLRPT